MANWIRACSSKDIEVEDLIRFDYGDKSFAIYRSPEDQFYCTDGHCTHEQIHLEDGLVIGHIIECPMHNGQFDYRTGEAKRAPACENLQTYPVKLENEDVFIDVG